MHSDGRQAAAQLVPAHSRVHGDVRTELRSDVEHVGPQRVLADDVDGLLWQIARDQLPGLVPVGTAVGEGAEVVNLTPKRNQINPWG